jgi:GT2 family glycosyltransferase
MRILGHIHTFNDEDVIDRSLQALLDQTYRLDEILIVDNASTDGTLKRSFPEQLTMIRHPDNLGTSGAVVTGMRYALDKGYDWIWILDADSAPRSDALEKLVCLYQSFPPEMQSQTRIMASLLVDSTNKLPNHGIAFDPKGLNVVKPEPGHTYYEFDVGNWSGCLFKLEAVRQIGLPSADYVLDMGELEYGYRGKRSGYKAFMHVGSILDHNIGREEISRLGRAGLGPVALKVIQIPPIRSYYVFRNSLYFWLYEYYQGSVYHFLSQSPWVLRHMVKVLLMPKKSWAEVSACLRGLWDGVCKNMHHRY